ncbi:MAG: hypothetical protein HC889_07245 [Synechococcaceae cyanobacterium SM1_2_3]|nr:hypothetical protein [Synechococcaceae cyanobacterium SM1_2_3]
MNDSAVVTSVDEPRIRLEISDGKLGQLLSCGALCVADFRCLDPVSKTCVWRLCLGACAQQSLIRYGAIRSPESSVESRL